MAKVLVVDDERSIRITLRAFLHDAGYEVDIAEDVQKAQQLLSSTSFDLVVTDIVLPRVSGVALLQQIRKTAPEVQVIMMTGEPTVDTATEAVRMGARDYLVKPVSKNILLKSVAQAVDFKRLEDEKKRLETQNKHYQQNLEEMVRERTLALENTLGELRTTIDGAFHSLELTLEYRDPYTAGHQRRVAELAQLIGVEMGLSEDLRKGIWYSGLIHDLGKIAVPADILNKPGRLTETEFKIVQTHPVIAYDILKGIRFPWPIAEVVFQHHERLDGSGYPRGLREGQILQEAKILQVADVTEAISSHRPYRPALGIEAAIAELFKGRGTLFDAGVVDTCIKILKEGRIVFS